MLFLLLPILACVVQVILFSFFFFPVIFLSFSCSFSFFSLSCSFSFFIFFSFDFVIPGASLSQFSSCPAACKVLYSLFLFLTFRRRGSNPPQEPPPSRCHMNPYTGRWKCIRRANNNDNYALALLALASSPQITALTAFTPT